jgi:uncharacterized membrane protein (DUF485 family)
MWASLAIIVIWLSVLFDAVFGPDIVNTSAGGDSSTVPSAVAVALFAFLATWVVARYGFRARTEKVRPELGGRMMFRIGRLSRLG